MTDKKVISPATLDKIRSELVERGYKPSPHPNTHEFNGGYQPARNVAKPAAPASAPTPSAAPPKKP